MKFVLPFALGLVLSSISIGQPLPGRPGSQNAFVPMAVSYDAVLVANRDRTAADFAAVRALGFNAIRLVVSWADAEPARGQYRLDAIDAALELASRSDLKVILRLEAASPPEWVFERYTDGRYVPADGAPRFATPRVCLDHPGIRANVEAFVAAATTKAAAHAALYAIDVGSDLETGFCLCPHTARRYQDWVKASFGDAPRSAVQRRADQAAFVAITSRDHLAVLGAATSARGYRLLTSTATVPSLLHAPERPSVQDDWAMAAVVDRYGVAMLSARGNALTPPQLALAFDDVRGAAGPNGWFASLDGDTTAADLRLWTWAAIARGARGVVFDDWRTVGAKRMAGLGESDVRATERAQTAAGLGRVIGRNPALFAPLRPAKAEVAIVYDPRGGAAQHEWARVYQTFFERNIQVDVVHADQLASGAAVGYAVMMSTPVVVPKPGDAAARVAPSVKLIGASVGVETRFLESSDVLMLIGLNHNDTRQRVTMTFPPDTQEAIWQNMETGAAVNFIAGPDGPTYAYTFGAKDALVLMIRKNIR